MNNPTRSTARLIRLWARGRNKLTKRRRSRQTLAGKTELCRDRLGYVLICRSPWLTLLLCVACNTVVFNAASRADEAATSTPKLVFESSAKSIIDSKCVRCHNSKKKKAGLDLSTPRGILRGSDSGRILHPGDPDESLLFEMIDTEEMPPDEEDLLSKEQAETIREWIAGGAKFREAVKTEPEVTQHDIIPLLHLRCVACHGGRRQEAGLDLRTKQSILKGGKSGPAAVPGKPRESLMIRRIVAEQMPPRRKLVSVSVKTMEAPEVERLAKWIKLGMPETIALSETAASQSDAMVPDAARKFWSFQSPKTPPIPTISGKNRIRNPIDAFILRKLEGRGLTLSPDAGKATLLRRVCFDLTGLPPAPDEIDAFLSNTDPQAYEKLVDRLLASRRYGERWARHWLDIAGYADSEGAQNEDRLRPHMYRYRDYVIRSFCADKPYSQFLIEQIAGDELADYAGAEVIGQQLYDNLVATGFLRTAPDRTFANITNFVPDRLEVIADEMDILGTAVMGLTLKCARCHYHKFDPISQRDYYRLTAIFKDAFDEHDWLKSQGPRTLPHVMSSERTDFDQHEQEIAAKMETVKKKMSQKIKTEERQQLEKKIKQLQRQRRSEPRIRALWSRGEPSPSYVLKRGNYLTPGRPVGAGVPEVLAFGRTPYEVRRPENNAQATGRRLALARWLTAPDHPLTSRVMANRIWQHHFGSGIVTTPGNFGKAGARPTHPELLDYLATEFVRMGWSVKSMHRLIVTSSTYRQSSQLTDDAMRIDPDGSLLSRMPLRRMDAESLRDTLLLVAGQLDETPFGPGDPVEVRGDGLVTSKRSPKGWRRSIYVLQRRSQIPTLLETYDYPQMGPNCIRRGESLVAPQALHLMNNKMVHTLATHFADRVQKEAGEDRAVQIEQIYLRALGRRPSRQETVAATDALQQLTLRWMKESAGEDNKTDAARQAMITYCHAVINLAEFLYID